MFFLLKAAFWLGLVFLLLPDNGLFSHGPAPARTDGPSLAAEAAGRAADLCRSHAETCASAAALALQAGMGQRGPARQAETAPSADTLTASDREIPFGGYQAPAGAAPRTAPLPPRRPA